MNGQWIGINEGTNIGIAIANIDDLKTFYEGRIYLNDANEGHPSLVAYMRTNDKSHFFQLSLKENQICGIDPRTCEPTDRSTLMNLYPSIAIPNKVEIHGELKGGQLVIRWRSDIGTSGTCTFKKNDSSDSVLKPLAGLTEWEHFKSHCANLMRGDGRRYLFRGQCVTKRLRTAFHRTGRADFQRFLGQDVTELRRLINGRTGHKYNFSDPEEVGSFYHLVQHHGYPTPLLDWSYSPYVAAFFAYRGAEVSEAEKDKKVRIFIFDRDEWVKDTLQSKVLDQNYLHVTVMEFLAFGNQRMIPQQAVSTVTNVDDIERYINVVEERNRKTYLQVIELPFSSRAAVMHELSTMGITAGSLFPGLDGTCEELKERFFGKS